VHRAVHTRRQSLNLLRAVMEGLLQNELLYRRLHEALLAGLLSQKYLAHQFGEAVGLCFDHQEFRQTPTQLATLLQQLLIVQRLLPVFAPGR